MGNHEVGFGKPPRQSRFKAGVSGNPKGRPKRKPLAASEIIDNVLNGTAEYRERGRTKMATRLELTLRAWLNRAMKGKVKAAEMLLKLRAHAQKFGDVGVRRIRMDDWLPDYPGQTAEQKTREFAMGSEADHPRWWNQAVGDPDNAGS
jgi:Family of unknown function (DUF5681)